MCFDRIYITQQIELGIWCYVALMHGVIGAVVVRALLAVAVKKIAILQLASSSFTALRMIDVRDEYLFAFLNTIQAPEIDLSSVEDDYRIGRAGVVSQR